MCNSDIAEYDIIPQTRNLEGNLIFSCDSIESHDFAHTRSFCLWVYETVQKAIHRRKVLYANPELSIWLLQKEIRSFNFVLRIILAEGVVYSLLLWCYPLNSAGQSYMRLIYPWLLAFLIASCIDWCFLLRDLDITIFAIFGTEHLRPLPGLLFKDFPSLWAIHHRPMEVKLFQVQSKYASVSCRLLTYQRLNF